MGENKHIKIFDNKKENKWIFKSFANNLQYIHMALFFIEDQAPDLEPQTTVSLLQDDSQLNSNTILHTQLHGKV